MPGDVPTNRSELCPCGSGRSFSACCARLLSGTPAATAEELMRSRYTAYVLRDNGYLQRTWHPSTRREGIDTEQGPQWTALEIRAIQAGGVADRQGTVEFVAYYQDGAEAGALRETSRFVREGGLWYYLSGGYSVATDRKKVGRNDPCPCGSGRKYKRCCAD